MAGLGAHRDRGGEPRPGAVREAADLRQSAAAVHPGDRTAHRQTPTGTRHDFSRACRLVVPAYRAALPNLAVLGSRPHRVRRSPRRALALGAAAVDSALVAGYLLATRRVG